MRFSEIPLLVGCALFAGIFLSSHTTRAHHFCVGRSRIAPGAGRQAWADALGVPLRCHSTSRRVVSVYTQVRSSRASNGRRWGLLGCASVCLTWHGRLLLITLRIEYFCNLTGTPDRLAGPGQTTDWVGTGRKAAKRLGLRMRASSLPEAFHVEGIQGGE